MTSTLHNTDTVIKTLFLFFSFFNLTLKFQKKHLCILLSNTQSSTPRSETNSTLLLYRLRDTLSSHTHTIPTTFPLDLVLHTQRKAQVHTCKHYTYHLQQVVCFLLFYVLCASCSLGPSQAMGVPLLYRVTARTSA